MTPVMAYIIDAETNEFRETENIEELDLNLVIEERNVEFLYGSRGDIEAIFAYQEGSETRIGIIHEGKLLVSANINHNTVVALLGLFGRQHNRHMADSINKG